nr:TatD family hydrolase [uncultured Sellimonas sp.]
MIFDTHAHYDDEQFDEDRGELLGGMADAGVGTIVEIGASMESSRNAVRLAEQYPFIYAAVGVHPDNVGELNEETFEELKTMCGHEKVVAVGEIGLDYHWDTEPREVQKHWFIRQLQLAREMGLPVNIHSRDAAEDTMTIMKEYGRGLGGIIHCFSYSLEMAQEYVKMGFSIGVGGVVTFKNGRKLKEIVANLPLEKIVLETDCPYMAPEPNRGKRNDSRNIHYVAEKIAELKNVTKEKVIEQTENNAKLIYFS